MSLFSAAGTWFGPGIIFPSAVAYVASGVDPARIWSKILLTEKIMFYKCGNRNILKIYNIYYLSLQLRIIVFNNHTGVRTSALTPTIKKTDAKGKSRFSPTNVVSYKDDC